MGGEGSAGAGPCPGQSVPGVARGPAHWSQGWRWGGDAHTRDAALWLVARWQSSGCWFPYGARYSSKAVTPGLTG